MATIPNKTFGLYGGSDCPLCIETTIWRLCFVLCLLTGVRDTIQQKQADSSTFFPNPARNYPGIEFQYHVDTPFMENRANTLSKVINVACPSMAASQRKFDPLEYIWPSISVVSICLLFSPSSTTPSYRAILLLYYQSELVNSIVCFRLNRSPPLGQCGHATHGRTFLQRIHSACSILNETSSQEQGRKKFLLYG